MTWSWQSSQEFLLVFSAQSLFPLTLASRNDWSGAYRDVCRLQSPISNPLGHLFILRTLT